MNETIITLIAWILMSIGFTLPLAFVDGEWKIWLEVWLIMIVAMVIISSGLWLLGVK